MNHKARLITSLILLLSSTAAVKSQTLKTYNGPFKVGFGFENAGQGAYSYYEDKNTLERVKHGAFSYSLALKNKIGGTLVKKITGSYKEGFKNGIWRYTTKYVDYSRLLNEDYSINATGEVNLNASYKDGVPNGIWTYSNKISYRDKHYIFGRLVTTPYVLNNNTTLSASFKDGYFCGPFHITGINYSLSGSFDEVGNMDGHWVVRTKDNEEVSDFNKGFLIKRINRALPNGEILEKEILDSQSIKIVNDFLARAITSEQFTEMGYSMKDRNIFEEKSVDLTKTIFNDLDFIYTTLLGDKHIKVDNEGNFTISKIYYFGGNFYKLEKK